MVTATTDIREQLEKVVEPAHVLTGDAISEDYTHDEALTVAGRLPAFVVRPATTAQVAEVLRIANDHGVPVTARGTGTGLSGRLRAPVRRDRRRRSSA